MRELALHLLDIAENSVAANARMITLRVVENTQADRLVMAVIDDGAGMDADRVARVVDPFVTSRSTRKVGLGIPLLKAAAEACNGFLEISSVLGKGTTLTVEFQLSHIDRMPLGDLASTWITLLVSSPEIHWLFQYQVNESCFEFDSEPIQQELGDIPLTEPAVLAYIRELIGQGVADAQAVQRTPA
jgi:hypothetical protein